MDKVLSEKKSIREPPLSGNSRIGGKRIDLHLRLHSCAHWHTGTHERHGDGRGAAGGGRGGGRARASRWRRRGRRGDARCSRAVELRLGLVGLRLRRRGSRRRRRAPHPGPRKNPPGAATRLRDPRAGIHRHPSRAVPLSGCHGALGFLSGFSH